MTERERLIKAYIIAYYLRDENRNPTKEELEKEYKFESVELEDWTNDEITIETEWLLYGCTI